MPDFRSFYIRDCMVASRTNYSPKRRLSYYATATCVPTVDYGLSIS